MIQTYFEVCCPNKIGVVPEFPDTCPSCGSVQTVENAGGYKPGPAYACGAKFSWKSQIQKHTNVWWLCCENDDLIHPDGMSTMIQEPSRPAALVTKLTHLAKAMEGTDGRAVLPDNEVAEWFREFIPEILALATAKNLEDNRNTA